MVSSSTQPDPPRGWERTATTCTLPRRFKHESSPAGRGRVARMTSPTDPVRDAGRDAVTRLRLNLAHRIADLLQRDPHRLEQAVEVGLIRREWLERPGEEPLSTSTPVEVVERMLERQVEKRPSLLPALGLTAIQVLAASAADEGAEGVPTDR